MKLDDAAALLRDAERLVVFTGAGASAESGIDTFRSDGGLWERYPPDVFATPMGLVKLLVTDPHRVARFLRDLLEPVAVAEPNAGHRALAALEERVRALGGRSVVVTQNVDRLHQDAGSKEVLEVHGSLFDIVDRHGLPRRQLTRADLRAIVDDLARAERGPFSRVRIGRAISPMLGVGRGALVAHRPNVVLFGEALPEPAWGDAVEAAEQADLMLVVGTSGAVYPAASLPEVARARGARVVGVGPEAGDADVWLAGRGGDVLPELIGRL